MNERMNARRGPHQGVQLVEPHAVERRGGVHHAHAVEQVHTLVHDAVPARFHMIEYIGNI